MLKLMVRDDWVRLFKDAKPLVKTKAILVYETLCKEGFDSKTTTTGVPLRQDEAATPASVGTKRKARDR